MKSKIEIMEIEAELFHSDDFKPPGKFYFRNAHGNYIYVKVRKRELAQKYIDDNFGINFYTIRIE